MKALEEIFKSHASRIMKQFDMDNFKRDFPTLWKTIEESLKAMQSDHDAEMMGLKEKLSNTEDWLVITKTSRRTWKKKYEDLLTQFRKG